MVLDGEETQLIGGAVGDAAFSEGQWH